MGKKHEYNATDAEKACDPVVPYEAVVTERNVIKGHTLDEAKAFINKRFKEIYRVGYDAI